MGRFKESKMEKLCGLGSGFSLFVLYVQYCRTVELMNHYIIFSIIVIVVFGALSSFFSSRKEKWQSGSYFSAIFLCMTMWPILFLVYAFFSRVIGFAGGFCLVVTSILMLLAAVGGMVGIAEKR